MLMLTLLNLLLLLNLLRCCHTTTSKRSTQKSNSEVISWNLTNFIQAINDGDLDRMNQFLHHPDANLREQDKNNMTSLMHAAVSESPNAAEMVRRLLQRDKYLVCDCDEKGITPFMYGVKSLSEQALSIVKLFLEHPISTLTKRDDWGMTAFSLAIGSNSKYSPEIVKMILEHMFKNENASACDSLVNEPDFMGMKPYVYAARHFSPHAPKVLKELLKYPILPEAQRAENTETALMYAARSPSDFAPEIVKVLLTNPYSTINSQQSLGLTALMHLANEPKHNTIRKLQYFLQHPELNVHIRDKDGLTAFLYVARSPAKETYDIMRLLLQYNESILNEQDNVGLSALMYIVSGYNSITLGQFKSVLRLCRSSGDLTCKAGYKALDYMLIDDKLHKQRLKTSKTILDICSELFLYASQYTLPLAMLHCSNEVCSQLFQLHSEYAYISLPMNETLLHCAIQSNSFAKCSLVLSYCVNHEMNYKEWYGLTPLELAIINRCHADILELLSDGIAMHIIERSIKKCQYRGESLLHFVSRLGVSRWISHFSQHKPDKVESPDSKDKSNQANDSLTWSVLRAYCSFKIRRQSKSRAKRLLSVIDVVQNHQTLLDRHKEEVQEITDCVTDLLLNIADEISRQTPVLSFRCILAGSTSEGTKCYAPNELDFVCIFTNTDGLHLYATSVTVQDDSSDWMLFCSIKNFLDPRKLAQSFYDQVFRALQLIIDKLPSSEKLCVSQFALQRMDKISKLQLLWRGEAFPDLIIYVDLVPAFTFRESRTTSIHTWPENVRIDNDFFVLAKTSRHNYRPSNDFRVSHCRLEREVMAGLPDYMKNGYIFSKAVRIADICGEQFNFKNFDVEEDISAEDFITSYILKNSFLNVIKALKEQRRSNIPECKYEWAEAIYVELKEALVKKEIQLWHSGVLLTCEECKVTYTCCQKRVIMLMLVRNILKWFKKNISVLRKTSR